MNPDDAILIACRRFTRASDLCDERIAQRLAVGRNDLRALNLLESGARAQVDVARDLGMTRAAVTALVDRLEVQGLVRRLPHPTDRRVTNVELADETWAALAQIYRPIGTAVVEVVDQLPASERERLIELVGQLSDVLESQPA